MLLEENSVEFHVAVVHDQVLGHEPLQLVAVDHVECAVILQAAHQVGYTVLIGLPVFLVLLDLNLGVRQLLVEFLQILLFSEINVEKALILLRNVLKRIRHSRVEPLRLLDQELLYCKQVPVLADRLQQVVEEFVEFLSQVVSDEDDVVPERDFVLAETGADLLVKERHPLLHICQ